MHVEHAWSLACMVLPANGIFILSVVGDVISSHPRRTRDVSNDGGAQHHGKGCAFQDVLQAAKNHIPGCSEFAMTPWEKIRQLTRSIFS
jgi:hypothetical protein